MHPPKIGEILMDKGLLTLGQVEQVLARQLKDTRLFGQIAADTFGLDEATLCRTVAEQFLIEATHVNLATEPWDPDALRAVAAHDAWTYRALPLRYERGELLVATSIYELPNAIGLLDREVYRNYRFVIADAHVLETTIQERYAQRTRPGFDRNPDVHVNAAG